MTTAVRPHSHKISPTTPRRGEAQQRISSLVLYAVMGTLFGIILVKSEVVSWYRIQEMFHFESFHMYGVLGSAFFTAFVSLQVLKRLKVRSRIGEAIRIPPKPLGKGYRYWIGGSIFGIGWAFSGACPGPLFALAGSGITVYLMAAVTALLGTWTYGYLRPRLPH
ncbi:MAG TPA: DUF6691 family protein [Chloroflexota bacterium]